MALVVSPTHHFARFREIELKTLGQETFLISNSAFSLLEYLNSLAKDALDFQKVTILGNAEAHRKLYVLEVARIIASYSFTVLMKASRFSFVSCSLEFT